MSCVVSAPLISPGWEYESFLDYRAVIDYLFVAPTIQLFMCCTLGGCRGKGGGQSKLPFISAPDSGLRSGLHHCRDVLLRH